MAESKNWFQRNKGITILLSLLIIAIIALFAWGQIEKRNYEKRLEQQRAEIISNSRNLIEENRKALFHETTKTLAWAVRSEALRSNYDQINMYLSEFVQAQHFELAVFADTAGKIIVSTDKKLEQTQLNDHFPNVNPEGNNIEIRTLADDRWISSAPVMGLNSRMGTLVIVYDPPRYTDENFINQSINESNENL